MERKQFKIDSLLVVVYIMLSKQPRILSKSLYNLNYIMCTYGQDSKTIVWDHLIRALQIISAGITFLLTATEVCLALWFHQESAWRQHTPYRQR